MCTFETKLRQMLKGLASVAGRLSTKDAENIIKINKNPKFFRGNTNLIMSAFIQL